MKIFLALKVRKSVLKKLAFAKSDFFLDLDKFFHFVMVDKFLLLSPNLSIPLAPSTPLSIFKFFFFSLAWVPKVLLSIASTIIQNIEMSKTAILSKFLLNFL